MSQECANFRSWSATLSGLLRGAAGNVAIVTALSLPVVLGAFGVGAEAASWMATHKSIQNAADAAAIAAATEADSDYAKEARAVAAQYGFKNGVAGVTIDVSDAASCPSGVTGTCYSVTIAKPVPLLLAQVTGYQGDTVYTGSPAKLISAAAVAVQGQSPRPYCLVALGTSGANPALRTNGAPKADLSGCNVMSNTDAVCNGHDLGADIGDAHDTNNGCGIVKHSNVPVVTDPYSGLASHIPADTCSSGSPPYPQAPKKKKDPALPPGNVLSGSMSWSGDTQKCGDLQLSGDVTITQDSTLYIYNGNLDLNGHTLQAAPGVGFTIVFAGSNSYTHVFTGGGTLDFAAPTSGDWSGMAIYQAPNLTSGVDISAAGNSPTWNLTGIVYLPHADVTFSGAVNKSSNGKSCFGMMVDSILINGTGSILAHGECGQAGVTLPTGAAPGRGKLVG